MLKVQNLKVVLEEKTIFSDINIELVSGEILIVLGKNGSGKTTFLRSLAGLIEPSEGRILCANFDINDYFDDYLNDYSYLLSDNVFNEKFSLKYYLNFWAKLNDTEMLLDSAISYFNLTEILEFTIERISSGWRKRLYFAKLILDNKLIWLLDEPFNFLDNNGRDLLVNMINSRLLSGGLVVLTTNQKITEFKASRYLDIELNQEVKSEAI